MKVIQSARNLAWTLGVPLDRLRLTANNPTANYLEFSRWKDARKTQARMIRNPRDALKRIQRLIKDRVFMDGVFGPEVHGGVLGCSPKTNAKQHAGARVLVTVDIKQFFDNVGHKVVFRTLRDFGYGTEVAGLLTKLTTRNGLLPQGAPTSVAVANLVLARAFDGPTAAQARLTGTTFTRYIDDIGLSGDNPAVLIGEIARRLSSLGLSIHRGKKLQIRLRSVRQSITGLNVNSGRPTVPREHRDRVRAAIHSFAPIADPDQRAKALRSINGRIAHVQQFQLGSAKRLTRQLSQVLGDVQRGAGNGSKQCKPPKHKLFSERRTARS